MARRRRSPAEAYHDRVANIYEGIYEGSPYWEFYRTVTWRHLKPFLPRRLPARLLDVGCGSGYWGRRLLKSGYEVDFLDISQKMLDQVAHRLDEVKSAYDPQLIHASIDDLGRLPAAGYDGIIGQGDPLNCAEKPARALAEMVRLLRPGGVLIQSVDNRHAAYEHFLRRGEIDELRAFVRSGRTEWLTDRPEERFPLTMFTPEDLEAMLARAGLRVESLIGKTVLPVRCCEEQEPNPLVDRASFGKLLKLEERLHGERTLLGSAAHLQVVARLPEEA
jgi:SAM-dependent methyltransferase